MLNQCWGSRVVRIAIPAHWCIAGLRPWRSLHAFGAQVLPYSRQRQTLGNCDLRLQPVPRLHRVLERLAGSAKRVRHLVAHWTSMPRAYNVLLNARRSRIAKNLGLTGAGPPVEASAWIAMRTTCRPNARRTLQVQRGHRLRILPWAGRKAGSPRTWSPVGDPASTTANIENGLYPSDRPAGARKTCACHATSAIKDKYVTHRIMGAGHPRMSFELDTFTMTAPGAFRGGQGLRASARRTMGWREGSGPSARRWQWPTHDGHPARPDKRGRDGVFPELTLFDCHACHHPMSGHALETENRNFGRSISPGPGVAA